MFLRASDVSMCFALTPLSGFVALMSGNYCVGQAVQGKKVKNATAHQGFFVFKHKANRVVVVFE